MIEGTNVLGYGEFETETSITSYILSIAAAIVLYLVMLPAGIVNCAIVLLEILMILWYQATGTLKESHLLVSTIAFLFAVTVLIGGDYSLIGKWLRDFIPVDAGVTLLITIALIGSVLIIWINSSVRHTFSTVIAFSIVGIVAFQTFTVNHMVYNIENELSKAGFTQEYYREARSDIQTRLNSQSDILSIPANVAAQYMFAVKATEFTAVFNEFMDTHSYSNLTLEKSQEAGISPEEYLKLSLEYAKGIEFPYSEFVRTPYAVRSLSMRCTIQDLPFSAISVNSPRELLRIALDTPAHPFDVNWSRVSGKFSWSAIPSYTITYEVVPNTLKTYTEDEYLELPREMYEGSTVYMDWAVKQYSNSIN